MNCLRSCLLGCLVLVSSSTAAAETKLPAKKDFHLYLLVGQSNMAGRGKVAEADKRPIPRVMSYSKDGKWVPAVDPFASDPPIGNHRGESRCRGHLASRWPIDLGSACYPPP